MRQRVLNVEIVGGGTADWLLGRKVRRRGIIGQLTKAQKVQHHNTAGNTAHEKLSARFGRNLEVSLVFVIHGSHSKLTSCGLRLTNFASLIFRQSFTASSLLPSDSPVRNVRVTQRLDRRDCLGASGHRRQK